jgi:acetyl-CoA synthetase
MDERRNEIEGNQVVGSLCIKFPWPGIARTIWVIIKGIKKPIFLPFQANILLEMALCVMK